MGVRTLRQLLTAALACGALISPALVDAQGRARGPVGPAIQNGYEEGYRQGVRQGERDARDGTRFGARDVRSAGRDGYRVGYADGYRAGYDRVVTVQRGGRGARGNRNLVLRGSRAGIDPYATGFERGYEKGVEDGRDGDRYDPVRHRNYRDGDEGYEGDYGSRDAYRNNYRNGFRQGYEQGYRQGSRNRR